MNSSILRSSSVWIAALVAFVAIEAVLYAVAKPSEFERTNFLQYSFLRSEPAQRLFVFHKVKEFAYSHPTIVQSGDSSGFYGIDPRVVMKHLPVDVSYLNMSCCANLGYRGYYYVLQSMAQWNDSVRYLVLHITPYTMPRPEMWDGDGAALWGDPTIKVFGDDYYHEFLSHWRFFRVPSLAWRRPITDWFYYANRTFNQPDRPLLDNPNYLKFLQTFRETKGWMAETDARVHVPSTECQIDTPEFFDIKSMASKPYLQEILEAYATMTKRYGATLVVVFQPVACRLGTGQGTARAREIIDKFKRIHPEVEIPFPLIETWPSEMFSVPAHVKSEYTDLVGNRLGRAMAEIVNRRGR